MADEIRIRPNFVAGGLSVALTTGDTTMQSNGLQDLPLLAADEHCMLALFTIDVLGRVTKKEIVKVTDHSAGAGSATIVRAQEGTTAQTWSIGDRWSLTSIGSDLMVLCKSTTRPTATYEGQMIFEYDTSQILQRRGGAWVGVNLGGNVTVANILTVANNLQVGWIELRSTTGDAAIDFTRTPGVADFDVRVSNSAAGVLMINIGGSDRFKIQAVESQLWARLSSNHAGGNTWNLMQFIAVASSGNNAGLGMTAVGQAMKICLNSDHGTRLVALNWDDGGYVPYKGSAFEVASAQRFKKNVQPLKAKRPVTAKMLNPVGYEPKLRSSVNSKTGKFIDTLTNRLNESEYLGFVADEVAAYAPEAVVWIASEPGNPDSTPIPDAIDVMAMVALVAQAVKALDERLDVLEARAQ